MKGDVFKVGVFFIIILKELVLLLRVRLEC